jgi:hypothetical protein
MRIPPLASVCPEGFDSVDHLCECIPDCLEKECGPDGCGGVYGTCIGQLSCVADHYVCLTAPIPLFEITYGT